MRSINDLPKKANSKNEPRFFEIIICPARIPRDLDIRLSLVEVACSAVIHFVFCSDSVGHKDTYQVPCSMGCGW